MNNRIHVAQEVVRRKVFDDYAYAHDFIGCKTVDQYYVKEEVVYIIGNKEKGFVYMDGNIRCVDFSSEERNINYNKVDVYGCYNCPNGHSPNGSDCDHVVEFAEEVVGIINIMSIEEFTNSEDISLGIRFIEEHNEKVKNQYKPLNKSMKLLSKTTK